jgi:hypothetical protein
MVAPVVSAAMEGPAAQEGMKILPTAAGPVLAPEAPVAAAVLVATEGSAAFCRSMQAAVLTSAMSSPLTEAPPAMAAWAATPVLAATASVVESAAVPVAMLVLEVLVGPVVLVAV